MSITTAQYIRKPLYVDAVRVTQANFDEMAEWCEGEVQYEAVPGKGTGKKFIRIRVSYPKNPRQTKAYVGDWLLHTEKGFKVYTNKAFRLSFDEVGLVKEPPQALSGDVIMGSEEVLPGITLNDAIAWLREQPELTLEQIRELVQSEETCSISQDEQSIDRAA